MASKRCKLDHSNEHNEIQHEKERNAEVPHSETLIYIIPKKIPKARLQVLSDLARKKEFPVTEHYRLVTGAALANTIHLFTNNDESFNITRLQLISDQQVYA